MAARSGRRVILTFNGAQIPGVREKGITLNGEPINTSSDEDNGWQTLISEDVAEKSIEVSLSGVTKSAVLKNAWFNPQNREAPVIITYPDGSVVSGTFVLGSYSESDPYNDAATFEATLLSNGEPTYTPYS